ncbi:MAG: hypothetical protein PHV20_04965 [Bacteroidales bacterium]|nr:hypothetical protein [Bacteroidales bacterium]
MKKIVFVVVIVLFVSCLEHVDTRKIRIINETNIPIYVFLSQTDSFVDPYLDYPVDTLLKYEKSVKEKVFNLRNITGWNSFIEESRESKMRVFLVLEDSVSRYGMKEVIRRNIYTKKYKLDIADLENFDWKIVYSIRPAGYDAVER